MRGVARAPQQSRPALPPAAPTNGVCQFTYFKIIGWGWFYLSTILDDYSRYIIAWKLCTTMKAGDVTATLKLALEASGCNHANVVHKPRLLSDNGSSYISGDLAEWLEGQGMSHVRGAPYHPQTQGKIERWHQTLKNRILLENYYLQGDLENQISVFVDHYNNHRYHESIGNVTPADAYFGRHTAIIETREKIKKLTIQNRRLNHQRQSGLTSIQDEPDPPLRSRLNRPECFDDGQGTRVSSLSLARYQTNDYSVARRLRPSGRLDPWLCPRGGYRLRRRDHCPTPPFLRPGRYGLRSDPLPAFAGAQRSVPWIRPRR